jgi:hypothetical protein
MVMDDAAEPFVGVGISRRAYLCLKSLYDQTGDSIMRHVPNGNLRAGPAGPAAGWGVLDYLQDKGLISIEARTVRITHRGIVEAERIIADPALAGKYFGGISQREVELVRERVARRLRVLRRLYEVLGGSRGGSMDGKIPDSRVTEGEDFTEGDWEAVRDYLNGAGLANTSVGGLIGITRKGIDAVEQFTADEERTVNPTITPTEIRESLESFSREHSDPSKVAFLMMRFSRTRLHEAVTDAVRSTLASNGITALRADDREYHHDLFNNVLTYLHGCGFGIAVFERFETEDFNPNVALEVGYMMALGKPVCFLKDRTLKSLTTDLAGKLYRPFDPQEIADTVPLELTRWLFDKGYVKQV